MTRTNEAFSRVKIDAQLKDQGWGFDVKAVTADAYRVLAPETVVSPGV